MSSKANSKSEFTVSKSANRKVGWGLVIALLTLLALNTTALQISNVVATAGFVSNIGVKQLPLLWVVDMLITLVSAGGYSLIIDQVQRLRLISWLVIILGFLYIAVLLLFKFGGPDWVTFPVLYILSDQQYVIFPLAFWALASDVYSITEAKRLFPIIAAGTVVGSLVGNGLAVASAKIFNTEGQSTSSLMVLGAAIFVIAFVLLQLAFRGRSVRARQSKGEPPKFRETLTVGWDFITNVPLFRYLSITMLLVSFALTLLEFHFFFTLDQASKSSPDAAIQFQTFYASYRAILFITTWIFQWAIAGRFLKKTSLQNTFAVLPAILAVSLAGALAVPGIIGGAGSRFFARLIQRGWDEPTRKSLQGFIPDERRGRVAAFMDSYFYAVATIAGCAVLGLLALLQSLTGWSQVVTISIYLVLAIVAALVALWSALQMRKVYEKSMLNWRLSRSRRKSMLDKLDF